MEYSESCTAVGEGKIIKDRMGYIFSLHGRFMDGRWVPEFGFTVSGTPFELVDLSKVN